MPAGGREEMIVSEIDADESYASCAHVNREAQSHVWRVLRVMQDVRIRKIGAAVRAEVEIYDILASEPEIELGKEIVCSGICDVAEPVNGKLIARINHDQIVRMKPSPYVVYADRDELFRLNEIVKRLPTATHDDGRTSVYVMKVSQRLHGHAGSFRFSQS